MTSGTTSEQLSVAEFRAIAGRMESEIARVLVGQREVVRSVIMAVIAGGHVLLEGAPGLGKTLLVRTLAETVDLDFARIQFTPDLLPADITGTNVLVEDESGRRVFQFQPGPIFANVVLADEINRATPKTQSALLEAMQEHTVTVANTIHRLRLPFFVLATQNPLELEGTYPLPEAQMDRFFFKLLVKFPQAAELEEILRRTTSAQEVSVGHVASGMQILQMGRLAREVPIARSLSDYVVRIVLATHPDRPDSPEITRRYVRYGASPRGAQAIMLSAKIRALLDGRYNVAYEDLHAVVGDALRHRIVLNFEAEMEGITADDIISKLGEVVPEVNA